MKKVVKGINAKFSYIPADFSPSSRMNLLITTLIIKDS